VKNCIESVPQYKACTKGYVKQARRGTV
jgi:hypothetical protein